MRKIQVYVQMETDIYRFTIVRVAGASMLTVFSVERK